jgi:hypothetical protein
MIKSFYFSLPIIFALVCFTQVVESKEREVSARIRQLANTSKNDCSFTDAPYCYKFKAIVDIESGYLRVWKTDTEGNDYVAGELKKGETIYVRDVFKYRGKQFQDAKVEWSFAI